MAPGDISQTPTTGHPYVATALTELDYTYYANGSVETMSDSSDVHGLQSNTATTTYTYTIEAQPIAFNFEHDKQKRLFILTGPSGKAEHFRDNPARQLMVEPDPETGEMRPVIKHGKPAFIYLCREEREEG